MLERFGRYRQRRRDLAAGVDADLVQSNWRKFKLAGLLVALGALLVGIDRFVKFHGLIQEIIAGLYVVFLLGGMFLAIWAEQEDAFLRKPDPKKPPSLFK